MAERFLEQVRLELVSGTVFLELNTADLRSEDLAQRYPLESARVRVIPVFDPANWESAPDAVHWSPGMDEGPT